MNNVLLIIQREYLTRVKKKSFIIMTILGPLLIGLMYAGIIWAAVSSGEQKTIVVNDNTGLFKGKFKSSKDFVYTYKDGDIETLKTKLASLKSDALVYIPKDILENPKTLKIFSEKGVSLDLQTSVERVIEKEIETIKLTEAGITRSVLESSKMNIESETISLKDGSEKKNSAAAASVIGGVCAFLIYLSVFIYGAQVMRGITEEKTSRIVEVVISSVKPFQLMIGKILGVGLVGLTQFLLWIVLTVGIFSVGTKFLGDKFGKSNATSLTEAQLSKLPPEAQEAARAQLSQGIDSETMLADITAAANTLPVSTIIIAFIFYFLGGYLLYSALFGAVGSAVDSDTDAQQFMLPITIPIIAAFSIAQIVIKDPNSSLAFWSSMVPFTSPIIMMVRIPFGVPTWQIVLSIVLLIGGFMFTTWIASRIYRVGILMYGKKVTWKELGKWLFYKP
jgi:ABC-2 type transport system permease protein